MFDIPRLAATKLVAQIDHYDSLPSTSDRALELAAAGQVTTPALVLADQQTAGRGRGANRWLTTEGALTFSLILEAPPAQLPPDRWPQVALTTGLAICEALAELAPTADLRLKWPNDVYLHNKKIAGILSESVPGSRDRLIVGIGININNSANSTEISHIATSLKDHDGILRDLTTSLLTVLDHFDHRWHALMDTGFAEIAKHFRRHCLLTGKAVIIEQPPNPPLTGLCRGIDDQGRLVVQTSNAEVPVISGTVAQWE